MEMLLEDYPSLPSASTPQHTPLNRCLIFKINGIKALSYKTSLKKIRDNPVPESQASAWAQAFFSTFLMGFMGEKLIKFSVKSFITKRMQPTQWPSLCWGKNSANVACPPGCHNSQLMQRTLSMLSSVCPKSHSQLGITNTASLIYKRRQNLVLNCAGGPGVQRLESSSPRIWRGQNTRFTSHIYSSYDIPFKLPQRWFFWSILLVLVGNTSFLLLLRFNISQSINNNFVYLFLNFFNTDCVAIAQFSLNHPTSSPVRANECPHFPKPSSLNVSILAPNIRAARIFIAVILKPKGKRVF